MAARNRVLTLLSLPPELSRLGRGGHALPGRGRRDGSGAYHPESGRSGLSARRSVGEAAVVDAGVGGISIESNLKII